MSLTILTGGALKILQTLPDESVQCCVTSPPYWGLRDYGTAKWEGGDEACQHDVEKWEGPKQTQGAQSGHAKKADRLARERCKCGAVRVDEQLGLEKTPEEFVEKLVAIFREVRRVLKKDGTCWVNLGDSYSADAGTDRKPTKLTGSKVPSGWSNRCQGERRTTGCGLPAKNLVGIPWRVAFALQADGWYLRSDIIWHKPNPMPESVTDRPTKSHEYLFLLTKSQRYYYDAEAIKEAAACPEGSGNRAPYVVANQRIGENSNTGGSLHNIGPRETRNKRTVWTVPTFAFAEAHFATYPPGLITPCILAGTKAGDTVMDPFGGSGTTGQVALELGRSAILVELNPEYVKLIEQRCNVTMGLAL